MNGNFPITLHVRSSRATVIFTDENKGTEAQNDNVKKGKGKQVSCVECKMAAQDLKPPEVHD